MAFSQELVHRVGRRLESEAPPEVQPEEVSGVRLEADPSESLRPEPAYGLLDKRLSDAFPAMGRVHVDVRDVPVRTLHEHAGSILHTHQEETDDRSADG